jgi:Ca2+-binding RTX toxin-like protein
VQPGFNDFSLRVGGQVKFSFDINDTSQVTYSGNTVTINPSVDLEIGTTYIFDIATNAVKDLNGNGYFGETYTFTTANAPSGLVLTGNALSNTLVGGVGNDTITGLGGKDTLTGAAGSDMFVYGAASHSTSSNFDTITDLDGAADSLDLWYQVTGVDTAIAAGTVSSRRFDSDLASTVNATKLAAQHAVLFTPNFGSYAGETFLIVDANGVAGYQAGADLVILLGANSANMNSLTVADFV